MTNQNKLAHALKIKFGLAPTEPTSSQLTDIQSAIRNIRATSRVPTDADWSAVVSKYCPTAGTHRYAGLDNSDLNTLLALAILSAQGK